MSKEPYGLAARMYRESTIEHLQAENAALRAGLSKAHDDIQEYGTQIDEMDAENAALRREVENERRAHAHLLSSVKLLDSGYYTVEDFFRQVNKLAAPDTEAGGGQV